MRTRGVVEAAGGRQEVKESRKLDAVVQGGSVALLSRGTSPGTANFRGLPNTLSPLPPFSQSFTPIRPPASMSLARALKRDKFFKLVSSQCFLKTFASLLGWQKFLTMDEMNAVHTHTHIHTCTH